MDYAREHREMSEVREVVVVDDLGFARVLIDVPR
jgi:hypothetical protein